MITPLVATLLLIPTIITFVSLRFIANKYEKLTHANCVDAIMDAMRSRWGYNYMTFIAAEKLATMAIIFGAATGLVVSTFSLLFWPIILAKWLAAGVTVRAAYKLHQETKKHHCNDRL